MQQPVSIESCQLLQNGTKIAIETAYSRWMTFIGQAKIPQNDLRGNKRVQVVTHASFLCNP